MFACCSISDNKLCILPITGYFLLTLGSSFSFLTGADSTWCFFIYSGWVETTLIEFCFDEDIIDFDERAPFMVGLGGGCRMALDWEGLVISRSRRLSGTSPETLDMRF